ncbi:unnamed protein product [Brugia timori]|uniref:Uncharacterized protein n=1 Tax=Brugia timori TaxID=42155 RepID=A0A0R3QBN1_9BILA|nr:unnamed protein product [Brugia timori]
MCAYMYADHMLSFCHFSFAKLTVTDYVFVILRSHLRH